MSFGDFIFWPFTAVFVGVLAIFSIAVILFWIWILVDCAKRKFKNNVEKIVWIVFIVFCPGLGSLVYFIVIKYLNPHGLVLQK
ncbi:hypothetical protein EXS72_02780 [Candidatus Pacearchaeota archaeon]|nr:hypothetical protein [Candidatus Pacearchaeota archaeon]